MHKKTEKIIRKILHLLEGIIAILTLVVMVGMVGMEVYKMITVEGYFVDIHNYLHNILTIVVGLEFVRMLIDMTPANTLEVLIVAIARQVIISHDDERFPFRQFFPFFPAGGYSVAFRFHLFKNVSAVRAIRKVLCPTAKNEVNF